MNPNEECPCQIGITRAQCTYHRPDDDDNPPMLRSSEPDQWYATLPVVVQQARELVPEPGITYATALATVWRPGMAVTTGMIVVPRPNGDFSATIDPSMVSDPDAYEVRLPFSITLECQPPGWWARWWDLDAQKL